MTHLTRTYESWNKANEGQEVSAQKTEHHHYQGEGQVFIGTRTRLDNSYCGMRYSNRLPNNNNILCVLDQLQFNNEL